MLSLSDKQTVYKSLISKLAPDKKHSLSQAIDAMIASGINYSDLGYNSYEDMLSDMKESVILSKGVLGLKKYVMLRSWEAKSKPDVPNTKSDSPKSPSQAPTPTTNADTRQGTESLPDTLDSNVYLPRNTCAKLNRLITGIDAPPSDAILSTLRTDYIKAKANNKCRKHRDGYIFPLSIKSMDGRAITATISPNNRIGRENWWLSAVAAEHPGKMLDDFAYLGGRTDFLSKLANLALPEQWDFQSEDANHNDRSASNEILNKYIRYTYFRLNQEKKVLISSDHQFAAFNTGLVTSHYSNIFACFVPNIRNNPPWLFKEFATAGSGESGKRLVTLFNPLPQTASYFERMEHLLFDPSKPLHTDSKHIVIDNISRLPIPFLKSQFHDSLAALALLSKIDQTGSRYPKPYYEQLKTLLIEDTTLFNRISQRIEASIELAKKQVRWNYKTAVPSYYPSKNKMSLMLPLGLQRDDVADVALVVELTESGNYQGQTILTLQQAYCDARLLCRPDSEWLDTKKIVLSNTGDEDDNI